MTNWTRVLRALAPHGRDDIIAMIADHADDVFPRYGITTVRRQACIIAHAAVETGNRRGYFQRLDEDLDYTAERLHEVWPKRFPTVASAAPFAHNPHALAIKVYGDRMGNRPGTDDGWTFRGKGVWNETGRKNVTALGKLFGVSAEVAAERLTDPAYALEYACALYKLLGVQPYADSGDVTRQTLHINGGKNGLPERETAYDKTVRLLSAETQVSRVSGVEEAPRKVTARDLRATGSRTIAGTDRVKVGLANLTTGVAAVTATTSTVNSIAGQMSDAADSVTGAVQSGSAALAWAEGHWKALAIVAGAILVIVALWQIWRGASQAEAARVDDARSGVNPSR
ncbi:hypothetical protein OGR47_02620 [Methylocystis sp. MJC1]|uniref:glycoside hydrolase family 19 protein n=1 Tax=Methylocystis sp. MJC1 TaxID=2654282 RepID=UPI0013EDCFC8|nr:hypothetical protein [Methylocystis sp. MJC1]KAF2991170.1 hypothetical protein MJC1_01903 [Methylocystis sp. MJC1]MBU6525907.1 hypothetical protein [Methylocystis sp. MJC1]UZX12373.1 hypothetical protein OGR47_02620 [Methylocystis sp. MJC1]